MAVTFNGNTSDEPFGASPMLPNPAGFVCVMSRTVGAPPSSDPVLASSAVPCSKNNPYPPRIDVLFPNGDHANPIRGAGFNTWLAMQPDGIPFFPHCTIPFSTRGSSDCTGLLGFIVRLR